jgi:hypothetical protein
MPSANKHRKENAADQCPDDGDDQLSQVSGKFGPERLLLLLGSIPISRYLRLG